MLSWKASMTFAVFCILCIEFLHSIFCISLTGVQFGILVAATNQLLEQIMITWVQPRYQGSLSILCISVHFSHMLGVTLSTFGKCLPI